MCLVFLYAFSFQLMWLHHAFVQTCLKLLSTHTLNWVIPSNHFPQALHVQLFLNDPWLLCSKCHPEELCPSRDEFKIHSYLRKTSSSARFASDTFKNLPCPCLPGSLWCHLFDSNNWESHWEKRFFFVRLWTGWIEPKIFDSRMVTWVIITTSASLTCMHV